MSKRNPNNLRIKRKYLVWLKDAKGFSEASIDKAAAAISTYERFLEGKDFRAFHPERAFVQAPPGFTEERTVGRTFERCYYRQCATRGESVLLMAG